MNKQESIQKGREPKPRYELTLAEFPVAVLSKAPRKSLKPLVYKDIIEGKDGKSIERTWRVLPDPEFGFGGPTAIGTLFEIFQIWLEQDFRDRHIKFGSIYNLLERKFKSKGKENYKTIVKDLETLAGLEFDAINAFWDNEKKAYVDIKRFKLFDYVALYKDSPTGQAALPFSFIKASEILWDSVNKRSFFPVGIKRDLFHSLKPLEQRVALYLEKIFRSQHTHRRDIFKLAEQLPIQSQTAKHIKSTLKRTCEGLIGKGYDKLAEYGFEKSADGRSENIVLHRAGNLEHPFKPRKKKEPDEVEGLVDQILEVVGDEKSKGFYTLMAQKMPSETIYRVLSEIRLEDRETGIRSKGAIFTLKVKRYAQEQGIDLGLKAAKGLQKSEAEEGRAGGSNFTQSEPKEQSGQVPVQGQPEGEEEKNKRAKEEAEARVLEAYYQTLNAEVRAEVDRVAEERLDSFMKERLREGRAKGEIPLMIKSWLKKSRNNILREKIKEEGRGASPSKKGKKGQEIS